MKTKHLQQIITIYNLQTTTKDARVLTKRSSRVTLNNKINTEFDHITS